MQHIGATRETGPARQLRKHGRLAWVGRAALVLGVWGAGVASAGAANAEVTLEEVAAAVGAARSWQVRFTQRYVPAGFETGASESGTLTVTPPASLRFDYGDGQPRVFATDGAVARWVDAAAQACTAMRVDASTWGRLPLAALLDPGAARGAFAVAAAGRTLTLTAREITPELVSVVVEVGRDSLRTAVRVCDASGNRNEFALSWWLRGSAPAPGHFRPALPGAPPCEPVEE